MSSSFTEGLPPGLPLEEPFGQFVFDAHAFAFRDSPTPSDAVVLGCSEEVVGDENDERLALPAIPEFPDTLAFPSYGSPCVSSSSPRPSLNNWPWQ